MSKKNTHFFFSPTALFLIVYHSQFSLALSIFLFSFTCSHSCSSSKLHQSSHSGTSLHSSTPNGLIYLFFIFSSLTCRAVHQPIRPDPPIQPNPIQRPIGRSDCPKGLGADQLKTKFQVLVQFRVPQLITHRNRPDP